MTDLALLRPADPGRTRILYLARFAPDEPVDAVKPESLVGGYATYHYNLFKELQAIGYDARASSKPYAAWVAGGNVDYIFSMLNRMPIRNPEIHVTSLCDYLRIPCLGAPANIRALAEDKALSKLAFAALGLPVAAGRAYAQGAPLDPPPFPGPYFVKDRFGAASEGIREDSLQDDWAAAAATVTRLHADGRDALVERFAPGLDITVPVIGLGPSFRILGHVAPQSDKVGGILTEDLKADDHLGNRLIEVDPATAAGIETDIAALWQALGPIDYFRADYRWDPERGQRTLLEINICCYLGRQGAMAMAAGRFGASRRDLVAHIVEYSLTRQAGLRQRTRWVV